MEDPPLKPTPSPRFHSIMFNSIGQCIQKFRRELRTSSLQEYKQRKRKAIMNEINREQLFHSIAPFAKGKQQIATLIDAIGECMDALLCPFSQGEDMSEQLNLMDISLHIDFLRVASYDVSHQGSGFELQAALLQFVMGIVRKYKSFQIERNREYQSQFYQLIDHLIDGISEQHGQELLNWLSSCRSLWVIPRLIVFAKDVNCDSHPHLLIMIRDAVGGEDEKVRVDALHVLLKILKFSQQQDIFDIYERFFSIPQTIINQLSAKVSQKGAELVDYWAPLLYLFNTFEQALTDYAKTGIISACGQMIATGTQSNTYGALKILQLFTGPRCLVDVLLYDQQMEDSKMWLVSCLRNDAYKHLNADIRKSFAKVVRGVMRSCKKSNLGVFCSKFVIKNHSLLVWVQWVLEQQPQEQIKRCVLQCVEKLLCETDSKELGALMAHLHYNRIITHIEALPQHHHQTIRQLSLDILERIREIQENLSSALSSMTL